MKKIKLYAIGDSLTAGYPFDNEASFPSIIKRSLDCKVLNLGVNGQSSEEILFRVRYKNIFDSEDNEDILGIATILCGSNDFIFEGEVEVKSAMNTLQLATICREKNLVPLVISPMLCNPSQAKDYWIDSEYIDYNKVNESILRYENMLKKACEDPRFNFDFMAMEKFYGSYGKFVDGLHPDMEGYSLMAKVIEEKILEIANRF